MFVPLESEAEAHFVCALLNSSATVFLVKSYGIETQTSTHVLEHVRLPRFNTHDKQHARLSKLSQQAHELAAKLDELSSSSLGELELASKTGKQSLKKLSERVEGTVMKVGSEAYIAALMVYNYAKNNGVDTAALDGALDELGLLFAQKSDLKGKKTSSTASF